MTMPVPPPAAAYPVRSSRAFRLWFPFSRALLRVIVRVLAPRYEVLGRCHVPFRGPVIIAPNHLSDADPPLVAAALSRSLWFMAKAELFEMRVLGPAMTFYQAFPVDPGSPDREALRRAGELLKAGQGVIVFPEGRAAPDGLMGPVLPGAIALAMRAGVPVVPCGIAGSPRIVPYGSVVPRPTLAPVRVVFGPPLDLSDLQALPRRQARTEATRRLEAAIRACAERAARG